MEKVLLIANPMAGTGWKGRSLNKVVKRLEETFPGLELVYTKGSGDATALSRQAVSDGYRTIIAAGGDGTINEAINGMAGSQSILGIIPMGTGNAIARELGLSLNPVRAASMLANTISKKIHLGIANGRYFIVGAGIGFDALMMARVDRKYKGLKRRLGVIPYIMAGIEELYLYNHPRIKFIIDGEEHTGEYGLVVKSNAGRFRFAKSISLDDGTRLIKKCMTTSMTFCRRLRAE
jgi:YegS/Rv2252/BmrU family lipid kinase